MSKVVQYLLELQNKGDCHDVAVLKTPSSVYRSMVIVPHPYYKGVTVGFNVPFYSNSGSFSLVKENPMELWEEFLKEHKHLSEDTINWLKKDIEEGFSALHKDEKEGRVYAALTKAGSKKYPGM